MATAVVPATVVEYSEKMLNAFAIAKTLGTFTVAELAKALYPDATRSLNGPATRVLNNLIKNDFVKEGKPRKGSEALTYVATKKKV